MQRSLSRPGVLVGTLFFALSLTPSLLPRSALMQGLVSGGSLAAGYGLGVLGHTLWRYMELPGIPWVARRGISRAMAVACALTAMFFLWKASAWQDSIRSLMGLDPSEGTRPLAIGLLAVAVFA